MPEIMIAVRPGTVYIDGRRRMVRKGRTTAHSTHPIVTEHPGIWEPIHVDYPVPGADAVYAEAVAAAGTPFAEALRRLVQGLADRGHHLGVVPYEGATDEMVPSAVVEYALSIIDQQSDGQSSPDLIEVSTFDAKDPVYLPRSPAPEPKPADVRAWARANGIEVSASGKIAADVVERYKAAHA